MNGLDYLILSIVLISALLSLFRGFVSEVLSLAFWIGAFWLASRLAPQLAPLFDGLAKEPSAQIAFAYAALLIGFGALGGLLIWLIRRFLHATGLGPTDRMLGLLFGLLRGLVIVTALTVLGRMTQLPTDPVWQASVLLPHFDRIATASTRLLPQAVRERLEALQVPAELKPEAEPGTAAAATPKPTAAGTGATRPPKPEADSPLLKEGR